MSEARLTTLRKNFEFFQTVVAKLMADSAGKYALIREQGVVGIFERPIDALSMGHERFEDGLFSIQKVTDRPFDLGFMSYGAGDRSPN